MASGDLSAKAQATLGLPDGFKAWSPWPLGGMDTAASAIGIADSDFAWRQNFIRLGDGNLRTAWDVGPSLLPSPTEATIVYFCFYTIGSNYYIAIFKSNGVATQVDMNTLEETYIGGGFYTSSGLLPYARQWGTQYLLICNRNTPNDYWVWDGMLLYTAGSAAPQGVNILSGGFNYSSTPGISVYGGSGSGMVIEPVVQDGSVIELNITNPGVGYQIGDQPQLSFSGGGSDTSAILVANLNATAVGAVSVSATGSGYTTATVAFAGGGGSGATGTVQISTGVTSVPVSDGGSGYTSATVAFSGGGGSGATATATIIAGAVARITVTAPGSGYTSPPTATISGSGTGALAGTVVLLDGMISGVVMTSGGSGYTAAPTVSFSGDGAGATGSALLKPSGVGSVTVVNGGSGFKTVPLISFVGGGGAGATGVVNLDATSIGVVELAAPGTGYTSAPTIAFVGGGGSGATATAIMSGDTVAGVTLTSGGSGYTGPVQVTFTGGGGAGAAATVLYTATEINSVTMSSIGQFYTSAPSVQVAPGANESAAATVSLMPYGVSGSAMETFLSRVWIVNPAPGLFATIPPGGNFSYSAPGSVTDFSTSDGGGDSTNSDAFLQTQYVNIRQSSGYLYLYGDGSVSVISNVSTSGSPAVTTYNYQNVDPQAGLAWRDALQDFGRSTVIANESGIFGLYGGAATKISDKMDGIFRNALFPPYAGAVTPSSAIATIFDKKHYLLFATIKTLETGRAQNVMLTWDEKTWSLTSQTPALTFIATEKGGSVYTAWGTDGSYIYPLFSAPSMTLPKKLNTKAYGADRSFLVKELLAAWFQASDMSTGAVGISGLLTGVFSGAAQVGIANATRSGGVWAQPMSLNSPAPYFGVWGAAPVGGALPFTSLSLQFSSTSPDFILGNWVIGYKDATAIF